MSKHKSILVPIEFFTNAYLLVKELDQSYELGCYAHDLCERLLYLIEEKFAAINRRNVFSDYKTALPGSPEREKLRLAYLDFAYCHPDWRSVSELQRPSFDDDDVPF